MKILSIETSCDETAIALIEARGELPRPTFEVISHVLNSQVSIHEKYGGVYPMLAKREHLKNLPILLKEVMGQMASSEVGTIAVTVGPGLEPALWTGIEFAKSLGEKWQKPVLGVNHMVGHLWSPIVETKDDRNFLTQKIDFPGISLLISGGHTELVLVKDFNDYQIVGRTRDDAVGEAFDKTGRLLGLTYPAGPKISAMASEDRKINPEPLTTFPSPMIGTKDLDFSYSGLKTAVLYKLRDLGEINDTTRATIARSFEEAAIAPLVKKTLEAAERYSARTILIGGGVSANIYLRNRLIEESNKLDLSLRLPYPKLTTDNAIMIGIAAYISKLANVNTLTLEARGNLSLDTPL